MKPKIMINKMFKERAHKYIRIGNRWKISKNHKKAKKKSSRVFKIVKTTMKSLKRQNKRFIIFQVKVYKKEQTKDW